MCATHLQIYLTYLLPRYPDHSVNSQPCSSLGCSELILQTVRANVLLLPESRSARVRTVRIDPLHVTFTSTIGSATLKACVVPTAAFSHCAMLLPVSSLGHLTFRSSCVLNSLLVYGLCVLLSPGLTRSMSCRVSRVATPPLWPSPFRVVPISPDCGLPLLPCISASDGCSNRQCLLVEPVISHHTLAWHSAAKCHSGKSSSSEVSAQHLSSPVPSWQPMRQCVHYVQCIKLV